MQHEGQRGIPRTRKRSVLAIVFVAVALATTFARVQDGRLVGAPVAADPVGIHKIQHVIVVMQENRSFDNYFGTFPGADGIPTDTNGTPTACIPDPASGGCAAPYADHADNNGGGPHGSQSEVADVNGGAMDGFVTQAENAQLNCTDSTNPICANGPMDVMGYHTESDIPNYWSYARNFVLQDRMFTPTTGWSLPEHLFQVSGWSAQCTTHDPKSCTNSPDPVVFSPKPRIYAWTDLTYLLHKNAVSWGYYVTAGNEPDCENDQALSCVAPHQDAKTPGIWNPLPSFDTVRDDGELGNIQSVSNFYSAAASGTLPAVSWVVPSALVSEHAPYSVADGQSYVTSLVNAVMNGPDWDSTAIFVSWDDWGGFYDHVVPPTVDQNGYGLRVPGLVISPYAKAGYVDHQTLSFDAYIKFIEDDFLGGQRLDPGTDGRPDPRPDVREYAPILGDLSADFNFDQPPIPPALLPVHPVTTLTAGAPFGPLTTTAVPGNGTATITSAPPFVDGGSPITAFIVTPYINGVAQPPTSFDPASLTQTVAGLTNGTTYTFRVAGENAIGIGLPSSATLPITVGTPLAPTAVTTTAGNGSVTVQWTAPASANGAPVTSYIVTPYHSGVAQANRTFDATSLRRTIAGLSNGFGYAFKVTAVNANGVGLSSLASAIATPRTVPGSPPRPAATSGNGAATLRIVAPTTTGGSAITGYVVTPYLNGVAQPAKTFASTATTQTLSALTNGKTYTFRIAAKNAAGIGAQSPASSAITVGTPTAPTTPSATAASGKATVHWNGSNPNGSSITAYVVTPHSGGVALPARTFASTAATQTVTGLMNGASYTFTVAARNGRGIGLQSIMSNAVTPH